LTLPIDYLSTTNIVTTTVAINGCPGQVVVQVFMNLISNAIDALEEAFAHGQQPQPKISIFAELVNQNQVKIVVADNGTGIPESSIIQLFEPFFTTKAIGKGTGLGLSISHQIIIEMHGGTLEYQSVIPSGTQFIIQLPICKSSHQFFMKLHRIRSPLTPLKKGGTRVQSKSPFLRGI
jgi:signal transduction histidine kinase